MKIGLRITLLMIVMSLVSVGALGVVLISISWNTADDFAMELTRAKVQQLKGEFQTFLELNWQKVSIAAETMGGLYESVPEYDRRRFLLDLTRNIVEGDDELISSFTIWEPNALEGDDRAWADAPGTNPATSRFQPAFVRTTYGAIVMEIVDDGFNYDDFYLQPARYGRQHITDPYVMRVGGENRIMTTISAPIRNRANRIVGVVGVDLNLDHLNNVAQDLLHLFDGRETGAISAAYSNSGIAVSHPVPQNIGRDMRDTESELLGANLGPIAAAVRAGEEFAFDGGYGAGAFRFVLMPVTIGDSPDAWSIGIGLPMSVVHEGTYRMIWMAVLICVGVLLVIIAASVFVSRSIARPMRNMAETLKNIATGDGDLTARLPDGGNDEIGDASRFFNQTIGKIRELILTIKGQAGALSGIGDDLAENMTRTASAMSEIADSIQRIKGRVITQSASVTETGATMEQVSNNIDKLGGHVERQSGAVLQASHAIEQMLASIRSVTETLSRNAESVRSLQEASDGGRSGLQEVAQDVQDIARESEGLMEINSVMENIASQTNLLSMNAAIEAAHAGDAGRGFAVVADEIRKLAESSSEQSKTIGDVLKRIRESMDKITKSTVSVLKKFEAIDRGVKVVAEQGEAIRVAMDEQDKGSRQVLDASSQVSDITIEVKTGSDEMLLGSRDVIKESRSLEAVTQEISGGMGDMAESAALINGAVGNASALSGRVKQSISELARAVSLFRV